MENNSNINHPIDTLINYISEKINLTWLNTAIITVGSLFILMYYLSLEVAFLPIFDPIQVSFLFFTAFFWGLLSIGIYSTGLLFPAIIYEAMGISIKTIPKERLRKAKFILFSRNFIIQIVSIFGATLVYNFNISTWSILTWLGFIIGISISIIVFFKAKQILINQISIKYDKSESNSVFWGSLIGISISAFTSVGILLIINKLEIITTIGWKIPVIWIGISVISSILSVYQNINKKIIVLITLFFMIILLIGQGSFIFKNIAYRIGIAEPYPVTLVFPNSTCNAIRPILSPTTQMTCEGKEAGILKNVQLLNELGERWLIIDPEKTDKTNYVSFEGKDVVVKKK